MFILKFNENGALPKLWKTNAQSERRARNMRNLLKFCKNTKSTRLGNWAPFPHSLPSFPLSFAGNGISAADSNSGKLTNRWYSRHEENGAIISSPRRLLLLIDSWRWRSFLVWIEFRSSNFMVMCILYGWIFKWFILKAFHNILY